MQKLHGRRRGPDAGDVLVEALVAIVLVSISMLGIIAMYSTAVRNSAEAVYRAEATFLADELIGRMRVDDRRPDMLKAAYEGGLGGEDGPKYRSWLAALTQENSLPGIAEHPPRVAVDVVDGVAPPDTSKALVTITMQWQSPTSLAVHNHVVTTAIH